MERFILKKLLAWKNSPYRKPLILQGVRQVALSTKSSALLAMGYYPSQEMLHETVKDIYEFQEMDRVPNLLAEEYAVDR